MKSLKLLIILTGISCQNYSELRNDNPILWSWSLPVELRSYPINDKGEPTAKYSKLHYLAYHENDYKLLQEALDNGADPNQKAWAGNTPLHFAAVAGKTEHCNILLNAGVDINTKNNEGLTALDYAINLNNINVERLLKSAQLREQIIKKSSNKKENMLKSEDKLK